MSSFERPNSFVMTKRRSRFEPRLNTVGDVVSIILHISIAGVVGVVENVQATRAGVLRTQSVLMGCTRACSCERCIPSLLASSTLAEEGGLGGIGYGTSGDHVQLERPQNAKRSDGLHESFALVNAEYTIPSLRGPTCSARTQYPPPGEEVAFEVALDGPTWFGRPVSRHHETASSFRTTPRRNLRV